MSGLVPLVLLLARSQLALAFGGALNGRLLTRATAAKLESAGGRPAWGRDYGPLLSPDARLQPRNKSADGGPCGQGNGRANQKVGSYGIAEAGSPVAPNVTSEELRRQRAFRGHWTQGEGAPVADSAPRAADVSPTDLKEQAIHAAGGLAGSVHYLDDYDAWATALEGATCEKVCMSCVLSSMRIPGRTGCKCSADCLRGPDSCKCELPTSPGWTAASVTTPDQHWRARCGGGDRDCVADCLGQKFLNAVSSCQHPATPSMDAASCISKLQELYDPFLHGDGHKVYCTHKFMGDCDVFVTPPVNTSRAWSCYPTWQACHNTKLPHSMTSSRESKSVWESIRIE